MRRRRLLNLVRTSSFRLTLLYAGLFGVSALVLFAVIYWSTADYLRRQLDSVVETDLATLEDQYRHGHASLPDLAAAIAERLALPANRSAYYLLQNPAGTRLAGNLMPAALVPAPGWRDLRLPAEVVGDDEPHRVRGKGVELAGGSYLFVAQDYFELDEVHELIVRAFGWGAGVTVALALLGGVVMSGAVLRRIEAIAVTCEPILAGDLGRRLPTRGTGDEFDRVAALFNAMLDRIERLMAGLRQVSSDIAHDLRTPLTRLRQNLDAARRRSKDAAAYEAAIDRAIAETDTILDTFAALLRIAQIEAGTRRAGFVPVDLSAILATVLEVYKPAAEEKGQRLGGSVPNGVAATGDRELLTQMLANLVENAIRHSPPGANIDVVLSMGRGGEVEMEVADDGPGIPAEAREKVFQRFVRLETSRTTPGSGLGLSLVAAIADLHGITVRLQDNRPGTRVCLRLPAAGGTAQARAGSGPRRSDDGA